MITQDFLRYLTTFPTTPIQPWGESLQDWVDLNFDHLLEEVMRFRVIYSANHVSGVTWADVRDDFGTVKNRILQYIDDREEAGDVPLDALIRAGLDVDHLTRSLMIHARDLPSPTTPAQDERLLRVHRGFMSDIIRRYDTEEV